MPQLIPRKNTNTYWCVDHQKEFKSTVLDWVKDENGQQHLMCPNCIEDLGDAEFAKTVDESDSCRMHDGSNAQCKFAPAVGECTGCGMRFCADCLTAASICIFCAPSPVA